MNLIALKNQLLHDLKASWQKTALLGVLFAVGLVFWLPPLLKSVRGNPPTPPANAAVNPQTTTVDAQLATPVDGTKKETEFSWERAEKTMQTDPLVRSVEVAAIHGDPFHLDRDQFPPPVLFEDEPAREIVITKATPTAMDLTDKLVLKSTIVGLKRRAAMINDKLYYEGRKIEVDGQTYTLTTVQPRRVILTQGETVFELTIPSAFGTENENSQ